MLKPLHLKPDQQAGASGPQAMVPGWTSAWSAAMGVAGPLEPWLLSYGALVVMPVQFDQLMAPGSRMALALPRELHWMGVTL